MKISISRDAVSAGNIAPLKNQEQLEKFRIAGKCVSSIMMMLEKLVQEKTSLSLIELSEFAENEILKQNCSATFKNYKGFPAAVCISVNNQLVHGCPTDYKLQEGDLVSFDFGATFEGCIADSATTCIFGAAKSNEHILLIQSTKDALKKGIDAVKIGNRIGAIGNAIYKSVKDKYSVINSYGGHGINIDTPHAFPFVPNRANPDEGIRIQPGLIIAIEPLLVIGRDITTKVGSDNWTVSCNNICAHEEHSLYVHEDHIEVFTKRDNA